MLGILAALSVVSNAERLPIRTYTTADGLPHNDINRIVRDSRGFLWFCTGEGLSRFDGYAFTNYGVSEGLPHPTVNDLLETRSGDYWIATNGGLCKFNPKGLATTRPVYSVDLPADDHVEALFTTYPPDSDDQLTRVVNTVIESPDGSIWCGTRQGLFRLNSGSQRMVRIEIGLPKEEPHSFISSLLQDRFGAMWIGTPMGLYRRWEDGSVARYDKELPDGNIHALLEDRRGLLWVGTREAGLVCLTVSGEHERPIVTRVYKNSTNRATNWVFDVYESSDGTLWAGTNYELLKLEPGDEQQIKPTRIDTTGGGFSFREIGSVAEDRDGNIWLGTINGAMKIARNGFLTLDERDGLYLITSVFESRAHDLCAYGYVFGDKRASVFEGGKFDVMSPHSVEYWFSMGHFDGQRFSWIAPRSWKYNGWTAKPYIIQSSSGEWWVGQNDGLYLIPPVGSFAQLKTARPIAIYSTKDGLPSRVVYSIYEDRHGDLWVSTFSHTGNGLVRWNRAKQRIVDLSASEGLPSLKQHLPATFAEDRKGNVWIGFQPDGLARYARDGFTYFTVDDGLPAGRINDLHLDDAGRLWVASSRGGISRIDEPDSEWRPTFVNYTTEQGLSSNVTTVLTDDLYGRIYVGTGRGVDQINAATGQVKHFTTADGLAAGDILSAIRDQSGMLWFAARRGLSRFLPERELSFEPPPVLINGLLVSGARHNVSAVGEADISLPDLSASENQLQIDFVGLSFVPGESLRYQYRLEGADAGWSAPTEQRSITYARLSPGRYHFFVRAVDSDGAISPQPASVTFRILPPFWQRWWSIAMAVALAGAAAYAIYRYRVSQLVELERVRTRIAADLHDDVGSSLSQISVLSEVLRNQLKAPEAPVSRNLSLINRVSQEALDSMSDIVWAINPQQDHLSDLLRRMRRVTSETLPARDIDFEFKAPTVGLELRLGADIRRQVFLMFKEVINNLVRHSRCTRAHITLKIEGPLLILTVGDNGNGFDQDEVTEGNGLVSLHRRARSLEGETVVSSNKGEGTTISIKVPHSRQLRIRDRNRKQ